MNKKLLLITVLFVIMTGCNGVVEPEEKDRILDILVENELFGQYVEYVNIIEDGEDLDKELGIFPYILFVDTNKEFYHLTPEQKHFILKETSVVVSNNIPSDLKKENGHINCSGKSPCRFVQIYYSYNEGSIDDEEATSELYSIDFIEKSSDYTVMQVFKRNEDINDQFQEVTEVEEIY